MTKELIPSLTHDAEKAILIKDAETNLMALLELQSALNCLSQMARNTSESFKINTNQLGCLIELYDQTLDRITDEMCLQADKY